MEVCRDGKTLMRAERRGSLYYLTAFICSRNMGEVHAVETNTLIQWHSRLGHPAAGSIKELVKKGVLQCSDAEGTISCDDRVLGKAKKMPYTKGTHTSTQPLD